MRCPPHETAQKSLARGLLRFGAMASALLLRGIAPSLLVHGLLLGGIASMKPHDSRGVRLYEIELEPIHPTPPEIAEPETASSVEPAESHVKASLAVLRAPSSSGDKIISAPATGIPAAARAGAVITAPESTPGDPGVDFSIVQGSAEHYAGGVTTSRGSSPTKVSDPRARDEGVPGPSAGSATRGGSLPAKKLATVRANEVVDLGRPPAPLSSAWKCAFPTEADRAGINYARARVAVLVGADGRPQRAMLLSDPGNGFGAAAQRCAMAQRYAVGLDASANPHAATTAPITVTFTR